jgi:XTP/dITP diphosphohydrolase
MYLPERGLTLAQLSADEKNAISHRGQASRAMVELMRAQWLA